MWILETALGKFLPVASMRIRNVQTHGHADRVMSEIPELRNHWGACCPLQMTLIPS